MFKGKKGIILGDVHFGKNDAVLENQLSYWETIINSDAEYLIIAGDLFDTRRMVSTKVARTVKTIFKRINIPVYVLIGNHDIYYKNTNKINSPDVILGELDNIAIISEPTEIDGIDFIPWISDENYESTVKFIKESNSRYCIGHFELNGFKMNKSSITMEHGYDTKSLKLQKYDQVISGHYHEQSEKGNIKYMGAPSEFNWGDADCERGFYFIEDFNLFFVKNENTLYLNLTAEELKDVDIEGKFIRIHVDEYDKYVYDFIKENSKKAIEVNVIIANNNVKPEDKQETFDIEKDFDIAVQSLFTARQNRLLSKIITSCEE